jgi:alkylhydroperoxidase family enzyme
MAMGWLSLLSAVRQESTLPGALRELLIMQIASLNGAGYEWDQHYDIARGEGLTELQLERIPEWRSSPELFTELERSALEYSEAMTRDVHVPRVVFDRLSSLLEQRQLLELTVTVAAYNMVSRVLEALEIRPEDGSGDPHGG